MGSPRQRQGRDGGQKENGRESLGLWELEEEEKNNQYGSKR